MFSNFFVVAGAPLTYQYEVQQEMCFYYKTKYYGKEKQYRDFQANRTILLIFREEQKCSL